MRSEYHVVFSMQPFYNEVEKKVAAGSFGGDSPLDRSPVTADQLVNFDSECFFMCYITMYIYIYTYIYIYIYTLIVTIVIIINNYHYN